MEVYEVYSQSEGNIDQGLVWKRIHYYTVYYRGFMVFRHISLAQVDLCELKCFLW